MMIDCHTHCYYSHDSKEIPKDMIEYAIKNNVEYLAFTDHCDKDCLFVPAYKDTIRQIDLDNYFKEISKLKDSYKEKIQVGIGIECGFMTQATPIYSKILADNKTDIIINSVHLVDFIDCYFKEFFEKKEKIQAYEEYVDTIRKSLDAPYPYDVIAHIGYVSRKAPYVDKSFHYEDFSDKIDEILKTIIQKGKALEINSHAEGTGGICLPNVKIIERYKELGGELITFGSDAHKKERICDLYSDISTILKNIGFKYVFKYLNHIPTPIKL